MPSLVSLYVDDLAKQYPSSRLVSSDRKAYISASIVGNALFLLVTSTTAARFNQRDKSLRSVADSFTAISGELSFSFLLYSIYKSSYLLLV